MFVCICQSLLCLEITLSTESSLDDHESEKQLVAIYNFSFCIIYIESK